MDGIAIYKALKKISSFKNIPVVFMTAKVQASEIGALDVISKPFD
jgi:DNA-binding response OmpR family regulator